MKKVKIKIQNGRVRVYIEDLLHCCFNQLDFLGIYSYRDDISIYGIDVYLKGGVIELQYETRETWEQVLKLLDSKL